MGHKGAHISSLRRDTGTTISVEHDDPQAPDICITIFGARKQTTLVCKKIEEFMSTFDRKSQVIKKSELKAPPPLTSGPLRSPLWGTGDRAFQMAFRDPALILYYILFHRPRAAERGLVLFWLRIL